MPSEAKQIQAQTSRATARGLVQRADELAQIHQVVRSATRGAGQTVYIEGGPGVGRTSLLAAAAEIGARAGAGVLRATARAPERGFRFGVALQLFEAGWLDLPTDKQEALLHGPTGPAARLIAGKDAGTEEFALVHALLWLTRTRASRGAGLVRRRRRHRPGRRIVAALSRLPRGTDRVAADHARGHRPHPCPDRGPRRRQRPPRRCARPASGGARARLGGPDRQRATAWRRRRAASDQRPPDRR